MSVEYVLLPTIRFTSWPKSAPGPDLHGLVVRPNRPRVQTTFFKERRQAMQGKPVWGLLSIGFVLCAGALFAQNREEEPAENLTSKSVPAIGYDIGAGATKINLTATSVAPQASGEAKVEAKKSGTSIEVKLKGMPQPTTLGPELLTYVLWAVTPDGGARNLGEIPINEDGEGKAKANTASQTF